MKSFLIPKSEMYKGVDMIILIQNLNQLLFKAHMNFINCFF